MSVRQSEARGVRGPDVPLGDLVVAHAKVILGVVPEHAGKEEAHLVQVAEPHPVDDVHLPARQGRLEAHRPVGGGGKCAEKKKERRKEVKTRRPWCRVAVPLLQNAERERDENDVALECLAVRGGHPDAVVVVVERLHGVAVADVQPVGQLLQDRAVAPLQKAVVALEVVLIVLEPNNKERETSA